MAEHKACPDEQPHLQPPPLATLAEDLAGDPPLDDRTLLCACRNGEEWGWVQLVQKYERLVFSIARNCNLSADDAADVTQIAFTALLDNIATLDEHSNLGGWLVTVAKRHSWRIRNRNLRQGLSMADAPLEHQLTDQRYADQVARWETVEWIENALRHLSPRCQQLLIALYFDGDEPSYAAIAAHLEMAEGSIGPTRARCLQQLKLHLDPSTLPR